LTFPGLATGLCWDLLARLDACCHLSVRGRYLGNVRHWEVIVRMRGGGHGHAVRVQNPSLVEALEEATRQATAHGWPE
jgi:hypothetical protein